MTSERIARLAVAALVGAVGCGSSSSSPGPAAGAPGGDASTAGDATLPGDGASGVEPDGGGGVEPDSGSSGLADSSALAGLPAAFTKYGTAGVRWKHGPDGGDATDAVILFVDYGAFGSGCTNVPVGSCFRLNCPGPDGGGPLPSADPGTVLIGTAPAQLPLKYAGPNISDSDGQLTLLWPPGTNIPMISSGGASVPAWSTTVTMPSMATVTAPATIDGGDWTVPRASDFAVSWQGTSELVVTFQQETIAGEEVVCALSGGHGVVPASLLGQLPAGLYVLDLYTANRQYFSAGEWSVRATADAIAACAGGVPCEVNVTLQ